MVMSKTASVKDVLATMVVKTNAKGNKVMNRFSKKNFNNLMTAIANDVEFTTKVAKKVGDKCEVEELFVSKDFRKWCKKLIEKFGVDASDAETVMSDKFKFDNMDGLYEFFMTAVNEYLSVGNKFDFLTQEDFKATISIKDVEAKESEYEAKNPLTGESLGKVKSKTKAHKELKVKTSAPEWLTTKKRI